MKYLFVLLTVLPLAIGCAEGPARTGGHRVAAEGYFRGVYACDQAALDTLAADDVVISYPVFESIFGTPSIRAGLM